MSWKQSSKRLNWQPIIWLVIIHLVAATGWYFFTWKAVIIAGILVLITGWIGVCLGYHRCLTHGSFKTYRPVRLLLAFIGQQSAGTSAIQWVAKHRKHHENSDKLGDPHSPKHGFWWSHWRWFMIWISKEELKRENIRYAPDLVKDPVLRFLERTFVVWHILLALTLFGLGCLWDVYTGSSFVVWGMGVRLVFVLHSTWFVNSAAHTWGYQNYQTADNSRNLWWLAWITGGEGWHNNHHEFPYAANQGHKWWEIDLIYQNIRLLKWFRIVWDIKVHPRP